MLGGGFVTSVKKKGVHRGVNYLHRETTNKSEEVWVAYMNKALKALPAKNSKILN